MKLIFRTLFVLLALVFAQPANAACCERRDPVTHECLKAFPPLAVVDAQGKVDLNAPTGQRVHISGLPANKELCTNFLFKSLVEHCATPDLHFEGWRTAKYCKGDQSGGGCAHIACDIVRPDGPTSRRKRR